jgi:uncharacterized protein YecT (DUF1311 family)
MKWCLQAVIFAVLFGGQSIASPTLAQTINCDKAVNTIEINECAGRAAKAADRKLNQVYQQLRPKLSSKQRQRLTQAQLEWIKFRDRTCEYEAGEWEGGTGANAAYSSCLARVTTQRTADLQRYLDR